jgi:hypothetical protein
MDTLFVVAVCGWWRCGPRRCALARWQVLAALLAEERWLNRMAQHLGWWDDPRLDLSAYSMGGRAVLSLRILVSQERRGTDNEQEALAGRIDEELASVRGGNPSACGLGKPLVRPAVLDKWLSAVALTGSGAMSRPVLEPPPCLGTHDREECHETGSVRVVLAGNGSSSCQRPRPRSAGCSCPT